MSKDTFEKSVLITGCSSGIGYDSALGLRARGWRVFASCRQEADCARLREMGFDSPLIDYADPESVESGLADVLEATGGTLDALFNNGAHAIPAFVEDLPREALRANFEVNLFGVHDLTTRVIPVMRAQGHGRIVNCSSVLGFVAAPYRGSYNATKFALEGLSDTMRIELKGSGLHVSLIEPGPITTAFRINAAKQFEKWIDWEASHNAEMYRGKLLTRLYEDSGPDRFELPPSAVTAKLIHALEASRPKARYFVTTPTYVANVLKRLLPTRALDWVLSRQ